MLKNERTNVNPITRPPNTDGAMISANLFPLVVAECEGTDVLKLGLELGGDDGEVSDGCVYVAKYDRGRRERFPELL